MKNAMVILNLLTEFNSKPHFSCACITTYTDSKTSNLIRLTSINKLHTVILSCISHFKFTPFMLFPKICQKNKVHE